MASRKQNTAQAKAAKQKKIAIGGAVVLLGVGAIQGPKMLKLMSGGSSSAPPAAAPAVAPVPVAPVPGAAPATPAAATPTGTKLVSFERFSSKDPFTAQIVAPTTSSNNDDPSQAAAATPTATPTATATGTGVAVVPKTTSSSSSNATASPKKLPSQQTLVIAGDSAKGTATIKVNGTSEDVSKGGQFPKSDPTFSLVSLAANGGSVTIGISGGSLKVGGKTFTLKTGESKTLLNTADGKRYTLTLVSVQEPNG